MNNDLETPAKFKVKRRIEKATKKLSNQPKNISHKFELAQAYESLGEFEKALGCAKDYLRILPNSFEVLALAARCLANLEKHEEANNYCMLALNNMVNHKLPGFVKLVYKLMSRIPGLRAVGHMNEVIENTYQKQENWLKEYVHWYEQSKIT
jgi:tetratricopeptide (TPR) repeat protein